MLNISYWMTACEARLSINVNSLTLVPCSALLHALHHSCLSQSGRVAPGTTNVWHPQTNSYFLVRGAEERRRAPGPPRPPAGRPCQNNVCSLAEPHADRESG